MTTNDAQPSANASAGATASQAGTSAPTNILVDRQGRVGLITLNRPKALNALNNDLMD